MKKIISFILVLCLICCNSIIPLAAGDNEAKITSPSNGDWIDPYKAITVKWTTPSSGLSYRVTVKNERTGKYIVQNEKVNGSSYSIKSNTLDFEERYVIWVGTYNGSTSLGHGDSITVSMNGRNSSQKIYQEADFSYPLNNQEIPADKDLKITLNGNSDLAYNLTVKDITSGKTIVNESGLTKTSYTIKSSLLTEGHSYKAWVGTYKKASVEKKQFGAGNSVEFKTKKATVNEPPKRPVVDTTGGNDKPERPVVDISGGSDKPERPIVDVETPETPSYEAAKISTPSNKEWLDPTKKITIKWNNPASELEYCLTIKDDVTGEYIVKNEYTSSTSYSIEANTFTSEHRYKVSLTTYADECKIGSSDEIYINMNEVDYTEARFSYPTDGATIDASKKLTLKFSDTNSDFCYKLSVVDTDTNKSIIKNKVISGGSYSISANTLDFGKEYKLWLGTYINSNASEAVGKGETIYIYTSEEEVEDATTEATFTYPESDEIVNYKKDLTIKWKKADTDTYYELTIKDLTDGSYITQNEIITGTSYKVKSTKLKAKHQYKAWIGTYNNKSNQKTFIGSAIEVYFGTDGTIPVLIKSLTADIDEKGLAFKYELTGDNFGYATVLVKDSNGKTIYDEKEYELSGEVVINSNKLEQNVTYTCEIQTYSSKGEKAAYKSQKYTVAKSGFSVTGVTKPTGNLTYKKGFTVKGVVGSAYPIAEAKIVIFTKGDEGTIHDIVHVKDYYKTAKNSTQFNIKDYDSEVNFGTLIPGEYTYKVTVVDIMGNSYNAVESNFSIVREKGTYDDVPSNHKNYEAIKQLSLDGILAGDETGKFRPNDSITRAEFVKMLYFAFGLSSVETGAVQGEFKDVPKDHWARTFIMAAYNKQIINGKGNSNFAPSDNVTFEEAAKMLVCIKGWKDTAEQNGGWSGGGYITVADENDFFNITSATNGNYKRNASRADVAQMFYNALNKTSNSVSNESIYAEQKDIHIVLKDGNTENSYQYFYSGGYDDLFKDCNVIFLKPYQYVALELQDQNGKIVNMKNENLHWEIEGNGIRINEPNTLCSTSTATNADVFVENASGERISHVRVISFDACNLQPLDFINSDSYLNYNKVSLRNISVVKHIDDYSVNFDIYNGWNIPIQVSVYDKNNKLNKSIVVNGLWTEVGVCEGFIDGAKATWDVLSLKIFKSDYINKNLYSKKKINVTVPIGGYIAIEYPKDGNDAQIACYLSNILRVMLSTKDVIDEIKNQGVNVDEDKLIAEMNMNELIQFFRETLGSELTKSTSIEFEKNFKKHIISTFSTAEGQGNFDEMIKELHAKFDSKFIDKLLSSLIGDILAPFAGELAIEGINTAIEKSLGLEIIFIGTDIICDNLQMDMILKQSQQAQKLENEKMGYLFTPTAKHGGSGKHF